MMGEALTLTTRESALVATGDKGKEVVRYKPIVRNDIPDWVISLIHSIEAELNRMDALITQMEGSNIHIREALPELVRAYEALGSRQNKIYDAVALGVDKLQRAQLEHYSDIVAQSQVFEANVSAEIAIAKAQSSEAYEELCLALGMQIQSSSAAWTSLSGISEKRERAQERLALQVHTQSEELTSVKQKAQEEAKMVAELNMMADAEKKQRKSDIMTTGKDMEKKF
jgi:septal ring factor EnvC (AmiA/AmiB activator)